MFSQKRKPSEMNRFLHFPACMFLFLLLETAGCNSDHGLQSNDRDYSRPSLLSKDRSREKMESLSRIKVHGCRSSDLHLAGLVAVLSRSLQEAGRSERVILDKRRIAGVDLDVDVDVDVERSLKKDFFSPLFQSQGELDKEDLVRQINSGSVCDLLMNLQGLCGVTIGWFSYGFEINNGEPPELGFKNWYQLRTK
jgi:hypothetical protein